MEPPDEEKDSIMILKEKIRQLLALKVGNLEAWKRNKSFYTSSARLQRQRKNSSKQKNCYLSLNAGTAFQEWYNYLTDWFLPRGRQLTLIVCYKTICLNFKKWPPFLVPVLRKRWEKVGHKPQLVSQDHILTTCLFNKMMCT